VAVTTPAFGHQDEGDVLVGEVLPQFACGFGPVRQFAEGVG
jgi:hypothetical protein